MKKFKAITDDGCNPELVAGAEFNLPFRDPHPFISYFYYRIDTRIFGGEATDIFDSIAIPLLSNIGEISIENAPDYVPEKDPKILKAVET